jgi:hypothetical protein
MKKNMMSEAYDLYICGRTGVHSSFWLENMKKEATWKMYALLEDNRSIGLKGTGRDNMGSLFQDREWWNL